MEARRGKGLAQDLVQYLQSDTAETVPLSCVRTVIDLRLALGCELDQQCYFELSELLSEHARSQPR